MIGNRILDIRKRESLNQTQFAERILISRSALAKLENGINNPSDQTIALICSKFNINIEWLTSGKGKMKQDIEASDADRFAKLMRGESENKKQLFRIIADMPDELLDKMIEYLEGKLK